MTWTSSNPRVIDINSSDGSAMARQEGKADIMIGESVNAVSIAHVSKVKHAELDQASPELVLNIDDSNDFLRLRVKIYLNNQVEDLMPVTQYDGVTLIRQNVALKCESEVGNVVEASAEVSEIEGYFCNIRVKGKQNYKDIPKKVKIVVSVSTASKQAKNEYVQEVLSFDVKLVSNIYVEDRYKRGISLGHFARSKSISVLSLSDFTLNSTTDDKNLKLRKSRDISNPNMYNITLVVPKSVSKKFSSVLNLENSMTGEVTKINVDFDPNNKEGKPLEAAAQEWSTEP